MIQASPEAFDSDLKAKVNFIWKVLFIGEGGVGKSTFYHKYTTNEFLFNTNMTIGCEHHSQYVERNGYVINLVIWDLGGQNRFKTLHPAFCKGCAAALLFYDLSIHEREQIKGWPELIRNTNSNTTPILLIGTKADLLEEKALSEEIEVLMQVRDEYQLLGPIITSSKKGWNITETMEYVVDYLLMICGS